MRCGADVGVGSGSRAFHLLLQSQIHPNKNVVPAPRLVLFLSSSKWSLIGGKLRCGADFGGGSGSRAVPLAALVSDPLQ